ncbi:hypothetical protein LCGC14_0803890 [marine sediment metagenome]|uniref:Uncharacterized protein n=1 Tax=marine sediment metagenome TaxID=412755 RepID=A0A0F9Q8M7_9ZZZZ
MCSDFVPKRRILSDVTRAEKAEVTTTQPHEYETGLIVSLFIPKAYGMELFFESTEIVVTSDTQFTTTIDTRFENPFVTPTFPPGFTDAQVTVSSGVTDNAAG